MDNVRQLWNGSPVAEGLCARCKERPRHHFPSSVATYCLECMRKMDQDRKQAKREQEAKWKSVSLCSVEGCRNPRVVYASGLSKSICREHLRQRNTNWRERRKREQTGEYAVVPVTPQPLEEGKPEPIQQSPEQSSIHSQEVYGLLADMLLLADRSRAVVASGQATSLELSLDAGGVKLHMKSEASNNA